MNANYMEGITYQGTEKVFRAGAIPYTVTNGVVRMMFMKPSDLTYSEDVFQLAKGRVEEGESFEEAAIREAEEELGLLSSNIELIYELGLFMGRTTVYLMKVIDEDLFVDPDKETSATCWMTPEEFDKIGRELHRHVVKAAWYRIQSLEKHNTPD